MATPDYLTPYDELIEATNLGERTLTAARAQNPLYQRDAAILSGASASEVPSASTAGPNPFSPPNSLSPPVPLSTMGTEQRIIWQALEDKRRDEQSVQEARNLDVELKRQGLELRAEQVRQNRGLASEIPKLREALNKSPEAYLDLKADLTNRFPIGMGSPESDRILGEYEKIYAKTEGVKADLNKAKLARDETAKQRRVDAGYKEAGGYGADVLREYAARVEKDPDDASRYLAEVQQRNAVSVLQNAGMNEQEIRQKYGGGETGRPFDYQAATQAPKGRALLTAERNKAGNEVLAMEKQRKELTDMGEDWDETHKQIYEDKLAYWRSLTPQIGDNRAGVQNMATKYVPYERTLNPAARVPPPQSVQPGQPGAAQRPSAVVTAPKAVPPPLNPAYPEQWHGGKRYVQMPDGKYYLSKVQ